MRFREYQGVTAESLRAWYVARAYSNLEDGFRLVALNALQLLTHVAQFALKLLDAGIRGSNPQAEECEDGPCSESDAALHGTEEVPDQRYGDCFGDDVTDDEVACGVCCNCGATGPVHTTAQTFAQWLHRGYMATR